MIASYILSRTLVPTLVMLLMRNAHAARTPRKPSLLQRLYRSFDRAVRARARAPTRWRCRRCSTQRKAFAIASSSASASLSCLLYPVLGRDFFPSVDAGPDPPAHARADRHAHRGDGAHRRRGRGGHPRDRSRRTSSRRSSTTSACRTAASTSPTATPAPSARSTARSCCRCARATGRPRSSSRALRAELPKRFPGHRVLLPAGRHRHADPELRPAGGDRRAVHRRQPAENAALAAELAKSIRKIPGAVDAHVHQRMDAPTLDLQMDRTRLQQFGLTAFNVGQNVLVSLSGSSQTAPAFWLNPQNGVVYNIAVQTPQYSVDSLDSLLNMPGRAATRRARPRTGNTQLLGNLVEVKPGPAARGRVALQHLAGRRRLRQRAGHRPRERRRQGEEARRRAAAEAAARQPGRRCAARCRRCSRRSSAWASGSRWRSCWSTC